MLMRLFTATALSALLALPGLPVLAQSFEEGVSAVQRGDFATALQHFEPLAEQGDAAAQYNLGVMYANGEGVSRNLVIAYMLENLAAAQGDEEARENRDTMLKSLTSDQINEGQRLASDWQIRTPLPTTRDVTTWP